MKHNSTNIYFGFIFTILIIGLLSGCENKKEPSNKLEKFEISIPEEKEEQPDENKIALIEPVQKYDPTGKVDPFTSMTKKNKTIKNAPESKKEKPIKTSPLEKYDIESLKLVGIFNASGETKGIVEIPSGRGYIVETGTPIGLSSGRVIKILKDRLIIEEKTDAGYEESTINRRELRAKKASGE